MTRPVPGPGGCLGQSHPERHRRGLPAVFRVPRWLGLAVLAAAVLAIGAEARLGGGDSYSGGGGGGGGGGSGGGGGDDLAIEILFHLLRLCWYYPQLGIPLVGGFLVLAAISHAYDGGETVSLSGSGGGGGSAPAPIRTSPEVLARLGGLDPNFSRPVFHSLVHSLFVRFHAARGHGNWAPLLPWLGPVAQSHVENAGERILGLPRVDQVQDIVIGGIRVVGVETGSGSDWVRLRIKANYVERSGGTASAWVVDEEWTLKRPSGSLSPAPETARTLGCPGCGAPVELTPEGLCTYCDQPVVRAGPGWKLATLQLVSRVPRPPLSLGVGGVEEGTRLPTVVQAGIGAHKRALVERHPGFTFVVFLERVRGIFSELQAAWSAGSADRMRPLESDRLFEAHRFWLERYRSEGLRNRIENVTIENVQVVRVDLDVHYESVTVRIFASLEDWTEDRDGKVVGGRRGSARRFSEYWTFLRTGSAGSRAEAAPGTCPACGAPLDRIGETGVCGYCEARIVSGEFGWILDTIEQDEEYSG